MGYIDIHSHILPAMDDGSKSLEQTLAMLNIACSEGITSMIATPHNMPGKGCPTALSVHENYEKLRQAVERAGIPISIFPGTEYFYREEVLEIFQNEEAVTLGASNCVLVEFDPMAERRYIRNSLRDVLGTTYTPVIAHVERYIKVMEDISVLRELKKMGVLVQVNASSVTGDNGLKTKSAVKKLLKEELVDFIGTDAHSDGHRAPYMEKCADMLYKKYGSSYADALLGDNAEEYGMVRNI
jgi:protein-tyrosine phosphatase